jgi:hypothetical protein
VPRDIEDHRGESTRQTKRLAGHSTRRTVMLINVLPTRHFDYTRLAARHAPSRDTWDVFVRDLLVDRWLAEYARISDWSTQVLEIEQGSLTFLFDAGPTLAESRLGEREDRVVAVWGYSQHSAGKRDRGRLAGFLPFPQL